MRYVIQRGDTLWDLARKHKTSVDELLRLNPHIKDRNKIYAGRTLNLPEPPPPPPNVQAVVGEVEPVEFKAPVHTTPALPGQPVDLVSLDREQAAEGMETAFGPVETLAGAVPGFVSAVPRLALMAPKYLMPAGTPVLQSNVTAIPGSKGAAQAMLSARYPDAPRWLNVTWRDIIYAPPMRGSYKDIYGDQLPRTLAKKVAKWEKHKNAKGE